MQELSAHLCALSSYVPALLITLGVGALLGCVVGCVCFPSEKKDNLFHHDVY